MSTAFFDFQPPTSPQPSAPAEQAEDGVYTYDPNHVLEIQQLLIELFRQGPRNCAVVATAGWQVQELEDVVKDAHEKWDPDSATGDQLDILGSYVGEKRLGRSDEDFRAAVVVRQLVNNSNGKLEELLNICSLLSPDPVRAAELYPCTVRIDIGATYGATTRTIYQLLRKAKAAGVRLLLSVGPAAVGAVDGNPPGGVIGAVDGNPAGFVIGSGT